VKKMSRIEDNGYHKINLNWYPGHMAKTKRQIQDDLKLIDVVIEILDARIPISSQNPDIAEIIKNKKRIILLNKSDLANEEQNSIWQEYFTSIGIPTIQTNSNTGIGVKQILKTIVKNMKDEIEEQAKKGRIGKPIRVMILGIPNVGKSSLINKLVQKNSAQVGNRPGVTKQKQWVKLNNRIELLDTPGVLWPKFENQQIALNLSYIGTIKDENLQITDIAYNLLKCLTDNYKNNLKQRYKLDDIDGIDTLQLMEIIARKRGAIKSGNNIDDEKIARIILDDFRSGKLGRITLERKEKIEN